MSLLEVEGINTLYGDSHVLFDVSLRVEENEVVALLGRNGAGKTTTLRTLMGALSPRSGTIRLDGKQIQGLPPEKIARVGMQLVPEERAIFGTLTVEENLRVARLTAPKGWSLDRVWEVFPRLKERRTSRGRTLSGGEQQRVAIARAIVTSPDVLLADEPTGNLDGATGGRVMDLLFDRRAATGATLVVITHDPALARRCDRVVELSDGRILA